jgi:hypothetical protein
MFRQIKIDYCIIHIMGQKHIYINKIVVSGWHSKSLSINTLLSSAWLDLSGIRNKLVYSTGLHNKK